MHEVVQRSQKHVQGKVTRAGRFKSEAHELKAVEGLYKRYKYLCERTKYDPTEVLRKTFETLTMSENKSIYILFISEVNKVFELSRETFEFMIDFIEVK